MTLAEFEEINRQIIETRKALLERERILSVMASIDEQLAQERQKLPRLVTKKNIEFGDVQDLEDTTLKSIIYTLLRNRDLKLEQEAKEYLEAKLKLEKCQIRNASLEAHLAELEVCLIDLAESDDKLASLVSHQIELIVKLNTPEAEKLATLADTMPQLQSKNKEYNEALVAGLEVVIGIANVLDVLLNGRNIWGIWKSRSYSFSTYNPIKQAIELSILVQPKLDRFQQELRDISLHFWYDPNMRTPKRLEEPVFIFELFHGLSFSDSVNQSRMNKWVTHLQQLNKKIEVKLEMIENEIGFLEARIEKQENEKQLLIDRLWTESSFTQDN